MKMDNGLGRQFNHNTILDLDTEKYLKAQKKGTANVLE